MNKGLFIAAIAASFVSGGAVAAEAASCNRSCTAAEWAGLSLEERAEIWPVMSRDARRQIWSFMSEEEKQALRNKLRPIRRDKIRSRYDCMVQPAAGAGWLTPKERHFLRHQVISVHMELQHRDYFPLAPGASAAAGGSGRK